MDEDLKDNIAAGLVFVAVIAVGVVIGLAGFALLGIVVPD